MLRGTRKSEKRERRRHSALKGRPGKASWEDDTWAQSERVTRQGAAAGTRGPHESRGRKCGRGEFRKEGEKTIWKVTSGTRTQIPPEASGKKEASAWFGFGRGRSGPQLGGGARAGRSDARCRGPRSGSLWRLQKSGGGAGRKMQSGRGICRAAFTSEQRRPRWGPLST